MKGLTLTQPWATLVALGAKHIETRSWPTKYRGPLAIHAAKGLPPRGKKGLYAIVCSRPFSDALTVNDRYVDLPRGAIVAVCDLVDVAPTAQLNMAFRVTEIDWPELTDRERAFGDFTPGRYGWLLDNVRPLPRPIPCSGMLGLWTPPDGLVRVLQRL